MKKGILSVLWIQIRILVIIGVLFFSSQSWAQCPEAPNDLGICDTLYVETFDCDHVYQATGGYDSVRVAIYVTHDSNTFWWATFPPSGMWVQDSIAGFVIPLTFWPQPAGYAHSVILPNWVADSIWDPDLGEWRYIKWNNTDIDPASLPYSIFRNLVDTHTGDTTYNRMLNLRWGYRGLQIESHSSDGDSGHAWLAFFSIGERKWWQGSRTLLATLTFLVYMNEGYCFSEIGIDSMLWPEENHLAFGRYDAVFYIPRHFLPVKDDISEEYPGILSITDVGNDQGRQLRLNWARYCYDAPGSPVTIIEYGIWRRIGEDKTGRLADKTPLSDVGMSGKGRLYPPGDWDFIKTVPARGESTYNTVCPTLGDSTQAGGMYWSVFFVSAMTSDPLVYFDSDPDSGYSLDNIPPLPIRDLEVNPNSWFTLKWTVPGEHEGEHPISTYEIRYNTVPVGADTQAWWNSATACTGTGFFNFIVGEEDSIRVAEESRNHPVVYFAIKGLDSRPNASGISNIVRFKCGDANGDGVINVTDVVYLINYKFLVPPGPAPQPLAAGDANCDGKINITDVVYLINYLFLVPPGPPPCGS